MIWLKNRSKIRYRIFSLRPASLDRRVNVQATSSKDNTAPKSALPPADYHQRGSLEHTLFGPFPRLVLVCINADFCDQGSIFQHFSSSTFFSSAPFQISVIFQAFAPFFLQIFTIFADFRKRQQIF